MVLHGSHILPSIYPSHVSISTSTMDPMGMAIYGCFPDWFRELVIGNACQLLRLFSWSIPITLKWRSMGSPPTGTPSWLVLTHSECKNSYAMLCSWCIGGFILRCSWTNMDNEKLITFYFGYPGSFIGLVSGKCGLRHLFSCFLWLKKNMVSCRCPLEPIPCSIRSPLKTLRISYKWAMASSSLVHRLTIDHRLSMD